MNFVKYLFDQTCRLGDWIFGSSLTIFFSDFSFQNIILLFIDGRLRSKNGVQLPNNNFKEMLHVFFIRWCFSWQKVKGFSHPWKYASMYSSLYCVLSKYYHKMILGKFIWYLIFGLNNWTEWSAIWSEMINVILESDEWAARV